MNRSAVNTTARVVTDLAAAAQPALTGWIRDNVSFVSTMVDRITSHTAAEDVRALVFDFLSHHALMLREWADRTEHAIAQWDGVSTGTRERLAQASMRATLERYPASRV